MTFDPEKAIESSHRELRELMKKREWIDRRMADLNLALRSLARMITDEKKREKLLAELKEARRKPAGLTEAISNFLYNSPHSSHSASEIREWLEREGFDLSDYAQPVATISITLRRLAESGRAKPIRKGRNVSYKWIGGSTPLDSVEESKLPSLSRLLKKK
ncbi:MAG TPA: hypothetical protein VHW72_07540 [Candidatus Angelobacter sp.]|jgi:predicted transcriptional regulator|nr:hypothetical protein [Candidatus Angelobacter sp.]